jgi:TRAP-type mannitol/chloroaromatic compound transport system substrate-binding protein
MNKKTLLIIGAVTVLGVGTAFTTVASAQSNGGTQDPTSSLVQKIADKFNLNKDEVQKVFSEHRDGMKFNMKANMQARHEERLNQLVSEGKITEEQKNLIMNKMKELHEKKASEMETWKDLKPEERRAKMEATRTELESWAKQNGINPEYLMFKVKIKAGGGHMMMHP